MLCNAIGIIESERDYGTSFLGGGENRRKREKEERRVRRSGKKRALVADETTDAFPRFFVETCARRGRRKG